MRRNETDPIGAAGGGEFLPAGSPEVDFTDLSSLEDDTEGIQDPQAGAEPEEPQQSDAAAQPQASDVEPPQDRAAPAAAPQGRVPQVNIPGLTPEDIQTVCQQYDVDPGFVEAVLSLGRKQMAQEFATSGVANAMLMAEAAQAPEFFQRHMAGIQAQLATVPAAHRTSRRAIQAAALFAALDAAPEDAPLSEALAGLFPGQAAQQGASPAKPAGRAAPPVPSRVASQAAAPQQARTRPAGVESFLARYGSRDPEANRDIEAILSGRSRV